jgi:hypothetical protein
LPSPLGSWWSALLSRTNYLRITYMIAPTLLSWRLVDCPSLPELSLYNIISTYA